MVAPIATETEAGTTTAGLLLERVTSAPPIGAAGLSVTVQRSLPGPVRETLPQEIALKATPFPVPLRAMTAVPFVEELLERVSCPVAAPVAAGSN
jgi:hypothetical protein